NHSLVRNGQVVRRQFFEVRKCGEVFQPGVGDLGLADVERHEGGDSADRSQSVVGHGRLVQVQVCDLRQAFQHLQTRAVDLVHELRQLAKVGQSLERGELSVRDFGVHQRELFQGRQAFERGQTVPPNACPGKVKFVQFRQALQVLDPVAGNRR